VAISNECGRLLANIVIAYNSILLSLLANRFQGEGDPKLIEMLKKISPTAWRHIQFGGYYTFRGNKRPIDLETVLAYAGFT